ncbi:DMT family transporter [Psychrobacter sp. GP33]|uniref:DMT family transporter n=1 Tax=Psychrobacter sp. GP33 TaxID=2758709 RepID=UPI0015FD1ACA|nr:DMT family transporter [Psychrobacter sp. GP33]
MKVTLYTVIALIAFAANSLFCRMALAEDYIDPWNFTVIRLLSAALCLSIIMTIYTYNLKRKSDFNQAANSAILGDKGSWISSISLLIYTLCFSIAYVKLDTGTGALILFSAVQLTMIGWGIYKEERLSVLQWAAFIVAVIGFVYLMLPSAALPSPISALLMAVSGTAWGIYSIRGKACISPLRTTGCNFIRSLIAIPILLLVGMSNIKNISIEGILLACASGAIASGIGYSIWYMAIPLLKSTQGAVVQLCVPVLAAFAGMLFLAEPLTVRFMVVSTIILGAVLVFILGKDKVKEA